jgi:cytochrome c oxidase cbb3-type subunit 4
MTYEGASYFAQTWGLVFLVALFGGVLIYTFWPRNRETFRRAARSPLDEADRPSGPGPDSDSGEHSSRQ